MDVVRRDDVIQDGQTIAFLCLEEPLNITLPVLGEFKKELLLMASVG
jgi:hypothetical protein